MVYQIKGEIVSTDLIDNAVATRRGSAVSMFFIDVSNTSWNSIMYDDIVEERKVLLSHIRKLKIIINRFFVGEDRVVLFTLLSSASPVADCANILGCFRSSVYRKLRYLRKVMHEFYNYFEKKTYKKADVWLRANLSGHLYKVFNLCVMTRNIALVSRSLDESRRKTFRSVEIVYQIIKEGSKQHTFISDIYIAWLRVYAIARSYHSDYAHKNYIDDLKDLGK